MITRLITLLAVAILLSSCYTAEQQAAFATYAASTATADVVRATATEEQSRLIGTATAESVMIQRTSTAEAEILEALRVDMRRTEQAAQVQATADARNTAIAAQYTQAAEATATQAWRATSTQDSKDAYATQQAAQSTQHAAQVTALAAQATATADAIQAAFVIADRTATATYAAGYSQLTATVDAAAAGAQASTMQDAARSYKITVDQQATTAEFAAWWRYAAWPLYAAMMFAMVLVIYRLYLGNRHLKPNERGEVGVVINDGVVVNPGLMVLPNLDVRRPVYLPANMHAQAAEHNARVRAIQALPNGNNSQARRIAQGIQTAPAAPALVSAPQIPAAAPWPMFQQWQGGAFLLGVGADGNPVKFDPAQTPHLLAAATSGAGKSMTILRPMAAAALSKGYQVVLCNDAGGDFAPLGNHPNLIRAGEDTEQITGVLTALAAEVDRRSGLLKANGVSTWTRLPAERRDGPPIMLILDELVALVTDAEPDTRRMIWRKLIKITSKGRKMSVVTVIGTTDPTERTLGREGLTVRDNCSRVALRVLDASVSRVIVSEGGAETLGQDQFMARLAGSLNSGVAFHPEDDQLATYIRGQEVIDLPEPKWLDVKEDEAEVIEESWQERARQMRADGMAVSRIARELHKNYNDVLAAIGQDNEL